MISAENRANRVAVARFPSSRQCHSRKSAARLAVCSSPDPVDEVTILQLWQVDYALYEPYRSVIAASRWASFTAAIS
jgi:hypothetical protein